MVGRLGPDLGARGPTRGGTRPCGGGGAQPSGMARGLSSRPEGAAAPGRRARNLGRSEQTGSGVLSAPRAGLCRTRAHEGPRAGPRPPGGATAAPEAGAAFPPKPRRGEDGSGCSPPRAAPTARGFVPPAPAARAARPGSRPAAVPARAASLAAPHRAGRGPAPSARRETKARGAGALGRFSDPGLRVIQAPDDSIPKAPPRPTASASQPHLSSLRPQTRPKPARPAHHEGVGPSRSLPPSLGGNLRKPLLLPPAWATSPYAPLTPLALAVTAPHQAVAPLAPELCLLPCLDKDIKFNVTRDCGASARPALVTPQPPRPGEEGPLPTFPLPRALIRPGPGPQGPDRLCPNRRSHMEPQPLPRKAGARAWPPSPHSRRASPWGPAPGPAAPAVLSPARGLLLGCPDLTDSGASGRLAARLFPGALHASLSAHKEWQGERRRRPSRSPIGRRPVKGLGRSRQAASRLLGPLRPLPPTGPGPGSPAARPHPCSAAPAPCRPCGRALGAHQGALPARPARTYPPPARCCARGAWPHGACLRARRGRALLGSAAPPARASPAPGPRPRPTLPAARARRARTGVPAPPPPQRRRLPGRQRCEAAAPRTAALGSRTPQGSMRGPGSLSTGVTQQPEKDLGALKFCGSPHPGRRPGLL
ncbi:basic proline-rich protein-like [Cervus canadensis]|uniref:basic proline-rich protein-like n=1 Tax=Cervus canadensis TaxID=1574408 RepID=UPI001C9E7160|nr:basic proline-rich protein-like [Cervus canadensis]